MNKKGWYKRIIPNKMEKIKNSTPHYKVQASKFEDQSTSCFAKAFAKPLLIFPTGGTRLESMIEGT